MLLVALLAGCTLWQQPLGGPRGAYRACTNIIAQQDGIPASQAQPYETGMEIHRLVSGDYAVTVLYPGRGSVYRCVVMEVVSGEWARDSLERLR
jgi:hypothetical protein